jgi:hypothetical protein
MTHTTGDKGGRTAEEMRNYLLTQLNSALRRPGMYGGEVAIRLFWDAVAFADDREHAWGGQARRGRQRLPLASTQRHLDLKNEFYKRVKERGATPDAEARLRAAIVRLKETIAHKNRQLARFRTDDPALVRALDTATLEDQQLRERLAELESNVHVLPTQRRPRVR